MARPVYETEAQRAAERETADIFIATIPGAVAYRLPDFCSADFIVVDRDQKTVIFVLEVKNRGCVRYRWPTFSIGQRKYLGLLDWIEDEVPALLLVRWKDAVGYVRLPVEHTVEPGGRKDRGDPDDEEFMVCIEHRLFRMLPVYREAEQALAASRIAE